METSSNKKVNIKYTEGAVKEMPIVYDEFLKNLERHVYDKKFVLGDDVVEVTASDIKKALQDVDFIDRSRVLEKNFFLKFVVKLYTLAGILLIFVSFFYDSLYEIFVTQPERALFLVSGFVVIFLSLTLNQMINKKLGINHTYSVTQDVENKKLKTMINDLILQIESLQDQNKER